MKTATQEIRHADAILATIKELYNKSGWNAVHGYLRTAKIRHELEVVEFGLSRNNKANDEKGQWLDSPQKNQFRAHYANRQVKGRDGYGYNVMRGQSVTLLP